MTSMLMLSTGAVLSVLVLRGAGVVGHQASNSEAVQSPDGERGADERQVKDQIALN